MVSFRAHLAGRRGLRRWLLVVAFLVAVPAIFATDTNAVLDAWLDSQTNLHTWHAGFVQTRTLKALKQPLVTTGQVWFARPNQFRWELGMPAQTIAVRSGDEMFVIYPLLKRAERYPVGDKAAGQWRDVMALLQTGFPGNRAELDNQFRLLAITEAKGHWQLAMQPRSSAARRMMPEIRVGLTSDTFELTRTELVFADGSSMRSDYANAVVNPELNERLFQWKPPPDFKVTEPMTN